MHTLNGTAYWHKGLHTWLKLTASKLLLTPLHTVSALDQFVFIKLISMLAHTTLAPFGQPTLSSSLTLLPCSSRKQATFPCPFCTALKSGVLPDCTSIDRDTMECYGTRIYTSSAPHKLYMCRQHYRTGVSLQCNNKQRGFTIQVQVCMSTVPMQRGHKSIRQAPCQLPSHQIHRILRGIPPWTTGPLGLTSARLCILHHQSQRGGPSFWGQGT